MARLIFQESFLAQRKLFVDIYTKNDTDGSTSAIKPYLEENDIDMDDDKADGVEADTHDAAQAALSREAEHHTGVRNEKFGPAYENMKGGFQFLKRLFKKDILKVGLWGVHITPEGKLLYPKDFDEQVELFYLYYNKHKSFTAPPSPLEPYLTANVIDIEADKLAVDAAVVANDKGKEKAKKAEKETELRNDLWLPVVEHMTGIGQFMMKLYAKQPSNLGDWGYIVDESPQAPKLVKSKVKLAQSVTVGSVIVGGTFTNLGPTELHVYKGKTAEGSPKVVPANGLLGIEKGFSIITVVNPSTLQTGNFKVLRHK